MVNLHTDHPAHLHLWLGLRTKYGRCLSLYLEATVGDRNPYWQPYRVLGGLPRMQLALPDAYRIGANNHRRYEKTGRGARWPDST